MVRAKLSEPDAYIYYPFKYRIGEKVRFEGKEGTIREGFFDDDVPGPFKITYDIEHNGHLLRATQLDLQKVIHEA